MSDDGPFRCPECGGLMASSCRCDHDPDDVGEWEMECDFCDGTGETTTAVDINGRISFDCPECGGTGWC